MITNQARHIIETWRLGFVATSNLNGDVSLSPKGTFLILDETSLAFAEMRSPNTLRNIAEKPEVEINFIDILSRKGVRIAGRAHNEPRGSQRYAELLPQFLAGWPELEELFNGFIIIDVTACRPLSTPLYELGVEETALRQHWKSKIRDMSD
ncbi:pyridoxamine 5'-phosphate oxidase family protein [uncultured Roseibium sp.]|uniref:pyridoxamine 5'-phosphate oxidase family protein n=1 Tax=uncultured Roseibium sp. TaxID=1936171 RepID=UPI00260D92AC|nr:pyridoxamine 5'-phosphate oxidase family protein [uncultured Roseibium sp.]